MITRLVLPALLAALALPAAAAGTTGQLDLGFGTDGVATLGRYSDTPPATGEHGGILPRRSHALVTDARGGSLVLLDRSGRPAAEYGGGSGRASLEGQVYDVLPDAGTSYGNYALGLTSDSFYVAHVTEAGALDTSFSGDGAAVYGSTCRPTRFTQRDGRFFLVGTSGNTLCMARLWASTGAPDTGFHANGLVEHDLGAGYIVREVVARDLWPVVVLERTSDGAIRLIRVKHDGTLDESYPPPGASMPSITPAAAMFGDGGLIVAGSVATSLGRRLGIARFDATGARLGAAHAAPGHRAARLGGFARRGDGSFVLAGATTTAPHRLVVAHMQPDGTPVTEFGDGGVAELPVGEDLTGLAVGGVAVADDGKARVLATRQRTVDSAAVIEPLVAGVVVRDDTVLIDSGPPAATVEREATFTFTAGSADGETYCRIDAGEWLPCSSPARFTGLSDGVHTFAVRRAFVGEVEGPPASMSWTVDGTPPETEIDGGPRGDTSAATATFELRASERGASFECSVDAAPYAPCASPLELRALAVGSHSLAVRATDALGNRDSSPATRVWAVVKPAEPCPVTARRRAASAASTCAAPPCGVVTAGLLRARPTPGSCFTRTPRGYETPAAVRVNGLDLIPLEGPIVIDPAKRTLSWTRAELRVGGAPFTREGHRLAVLPKLTVTSPTLAEPQLDIKLPVGGGRLGGLNLVGGELALEANRAGASLELSVTLGPDTGGHTVKVTLETTDAGGLKPAIEHEALEEIRIGPLRIQDLKLSLVGLAEEIALEGALVLPLKPAGGIERTLEAALSIKKGRVASARLVANGLNRKLRLPMVPATEMLYLQRVGGSIEFDPKEGPTLSGILGLSFGPRFEVDGDPVELASADGEAKVAWRTRSWQLAGTIALLGATLGNATTSFDAESGSLAFTGNMSYPPEPGDGTSDAFRGILEAAGRVRVAGAVDGFFDPRAKVFSAHGSAEVVLQGPFGIRSPVRAELQLSNTGFIACAGPEGHRVGFSRTWGRRAEVRLYHPFGTGPRCDLGPWKPAREAAGPAAAGETIRVSPAQPLLAVAALGNDAAPRVALVGPAGERLEASRQPDTSVVTGHDFIVRDEPQHATVALVTKPAAGLWRVEQLDGSSPAPVVQTATALPPPRVRARVTGRGGRRALSWRISRQPGQQVRFVEAARGGAARVILTTAAARGRQLFAPAPAVGRERAIHAIVLQNGQPRTSFRVARFEAAAQPRVGRIRGLRVKRRGGRLHVRWRTVRGNDGYRVQALLRRGRTVVAYPRRPRVVIALGRRAPARVRVVAFGRDGRLGRPGVARAPRFLAAEAAAKAGGDGQLEL